VSWNDAAAYCDWAGVELPTEGQWQYAARAGGTCLNGQPRTLFPWGDDLREADARCGNFRDESFTGPSSEQPIVEGYDDGYALDAPVASFGPNGFGLRDMQGNVREWCQDWYRKDFHAERGRQGVAIGPVCTEAGQGHAALGA
jgi:sulfatase modifying factor 1